MVADDAPIPKRDSARWVTIVQIVLLAIALALSAYVAIQAFKPKPVGPLRRFPPGGGFAGRGQRAQGMRGKPSVDRKLVKRHLDAAGSDREPRLKESSSIRQDCLPC